MCVCVHPASDSQPNALWLECEVSGLWRKEGSQRCCCFVCQVVRLAAVLIGWTSAQLKETYCVWSPGCDGRRELGRQEGASSEQDRLCAYHPNSIAHELPWEHHYYFLWVCWVRVLSPRRHGRLVFLCEDRCSLESSSFKWTFNRKKKKRLFTFYLWVQNGCFFI